MRELTKSMLGFSLAMPLFGMKQMMAIALPRDPSRPFGKATDSFDAVTGATAGQMDGAWKSALQAGDRLQRGVVDLMLGVLTGDSFDLNRMMKMTSGMLQTSIGAVGRGLGDCGCGGSQAAAGGVPPAGAKWGVGRTKGAGSPDAASSSDAAGFPGAGGSPGAVGSQGSAGSPAGAGLRDFGGSQGSSQGSMAAPGSGAAQGSWGSIATGGSSPAATSAEAGAALSPPPGWTVSVPDV